MGCRASTPALAKPPTWNEIVAGEGGGYYSDYSTPMGAAESKEEEAGDGAPSGRFWTSDRTAEVPVRYAAKGVGSEAHWPARTIGEVFAKAARESGARRALCVEDVGPDAAPVRHPRHPLPSRRRSARAAPRPARPPPPAPQWGAFFRGRGPWEGRGRARGGLVARGRSQRGCLRIQLAAAVAGCVAAPPAFPGPPAGLLS